ncbi:alpha/beta hydrolase [Solwaraspora sp. WMMB335]|uniref:alpha/beta hydrolase n=1 Tax=Solwaraspora sp. WMMB335 TaxID=3404118 RepID=UPI003B95E983
MDRGAGRAGQRVALLTEAADGEPVRPSDGFAALLAVVFTDVDTNLGTAQAAIACGDVAAAGDPESYWRDVEASRARNPVFGPLTNNVSLCVFWPAPREEPTRIGTDAAPLIVAATGDPRTTYASSQKLHRQLPSSRLLTLVGAARHGLYGQYGNECVDTTVTDYLDTGRLPADDVDC